MEHTKWKVKCTLPLNSQSLSLSCRVDCSKMDFTYSRQMTPDPMRSGHNWERRRRRRRKGMTAEGRKQKQTMRKWCKRGDKMWDERSRTNENWLRSKWTQKKEKWEGKWKEGVRGDEKMWYWEGKERKWGTTRHKKHGRKEEQGELEGAKGDDLRSNMVGGEEGDLQRGGGMQTFNVHDHVQLKWCSNSPF